MFDQLKVNQNSLINLLKTPERENPDMYGKRTSSDFLSMVMDRTGFDRNENSTISGNMQNSRVENIENRTEKTDNRPDERGITARERETFSDRNKISSEQTSRNESSREAANDGRNSQVSKKSTDETKSSKTKKEKDLDEQQFIAEQLGIDGNLKKIIDMIKAALNGNGKGVNENFQKLAGNLKFKGEKDSLNQNNIMKNSSPEKNLKLSDDFIKTVSELKKSISRELSKIVDSRKGSGNKKQLDDRELKSLAMEIIEGVKKGKWKENVKHEQKMVSADEVKGDRKSAQTIEPFLNRKLDSPDNSSFDKNGTMDRNGGRDNYSFGNTKIDISRMTSSDKMESSLKMPDFRENLQEIIDKAKVTVRDSRNGSFTVRLNPQELGSVNVNLIMENGIITGKFLVDNEDAKNMLMGNLNDLKYQLENAGVSVGEFSVNVDNQREKYLMQNNDGYKSGSSPVVNEIELVSAAESYFAGAENYTGHINMVI